MLNRRAYVAPHQTDEFIEMCVRAREATRPDNPATVPPRPEPHEGYIDEFGDERQAVADSTANLVIAFHRWCRRKGIEPPTLAEYQAMLDEAARMRR